ncbi:glycoside hydrolase family 3 C-terminal domain-containing protein [Cohnella xylanilytica]|uniref:Glycoside hydrolase family 3 C-terminal domain-containing protein n=1 Tax=Cohnella xylanilytica TaxID=557555 RepID=A0A841UBK4_9BACL|nr:glycoside hydrolase family 3 C-terminal domain-containing protein [Cohnella xylanilytica]MBB6695593.1 glycoside hydrolase family 3 C-terminal domain-containing protein [Cohnella xylanilytica]
MERDLKKLISQMTLEEKAGMCSGLDFWRLKGVERLGIPSIMVTDGPHGLRKQKEGADHIGIFDSVPATCFPSAAGVASSWDRELIEKMGQALGEECQAEDVAVLLGPGANIKRSPLCGRNFEYFSEDPYLSSEMAAHHIRGVQSQGVGTSLKHFAANNQEHRRMTSDSVADERTLREIYLASFEGAVKKSQPWTVMCSYNKVNGTFASENEYLLTDILKDEWGHEGFVVSDWGAVNERADALAAGLELEMPASGGAGERKIVEAVRAGKLPEEKLDRAVERLLRIIFKAVDNKKQGAGYNADAHHRLARVVARESMVLLKNEDGILPLAREGNIAVIGALAASPRYQGGGSSHVKPTRLEDIREEIKRVAGDGANVAYAQGYNLDSDDADAKLAEEAVRAAAEANVAVLFAGLPERYESEGYDRTHLRIPANQAALIEAVAKAQPNLVVVLSNGSPVEMPWIGSAKAVLEAYLGGQALGGAIADLLFGDANPCGKLAETFPQRLEDNPSYLFYFGEGDRTEYREGVFVGYRYYDKKRIEPLFPFGHGLSYTSFAYSELVIGKNEIRDDETVDVQVVVENTGDRTGKEIVQLYVREVDSKVIRPEKELKGFAKVELRPGERKTVTFTLDKRSFAYYDAERKDWRVDTGVFEILIGKSSRDIALTGTIAVESTTVIRARATRNTILGDLLADPARRPIVEEIMKRQNPMGDLGEHGDASGMMEAIMKYMPLRALISFSGGAMSEEHLDRILEQLNQVG